jgi:DNA-directed RNA polymerase specialized sigma24 family protein
MPTPKDSTAAGTVPPALEVVAVAVLTLLVDEREARVGSQPDTVPTEVLLDEAGLNSGQIGALVRKSAATVRKDLSRARAPKRAAR